VMSNQLTGEFNLARDIADTSRNETYGLHFKVDWDSLIAKGLIIKALDINSNQTSVFTDAEVEILESRLIDLYF